MLDRLTYISSTGKIIDFGEGNIIINTSDLRDYEWNFTRFNQRIRSFKKNAVTRTLPVLIYGANARTIANEIHDIMEEDIINGKSGKLYADDFYLQGFFTGNKKSSYVRPDILKFSLTFVADNPWWIKETLYAYYPDSPSATTFPKDSSDNYYIINPSPVPQDLKIVVMGGNAEPRVTIGSYLYHVATIPSSDSEGVRINTMTKEVILYTSGGGEENGFRYRDRDNYIFQKIPSGKSIFSVTPDTRTWVTLIEKRSEPRWQ